MIRFSYAKLNRLSDKELKGYNLIVASRTVSRYLPKSITNELNNDYKERLQPTHDLLKDWKDKKINESIYTERYLSEPKYKTALIELLKLEETTGKEVVLLCHCGKDKFCHTNLLLDELKRNGAGIMILTKQDYFMALDNMFGNELKHEINSPYPIERKLMIIKGTTRISDKEKQIAKEYYESLLETKESVYY